MEDVVSKHPNSVPVFASHPKVQEGCHSKDGGTFHSVTGSTFQSVDGSGRTPVDGKDSPILLDEGVLDGDVPMDGNDGNVV